MLLRRLVTATSSLALAAALGAFWSEGLLAHSGEARLVTVPAEAEPGQEVDVFGEDLEVDSAVRVELLAPSGPIPVGEGRSDAGGHVALTIVLPSSLVPRVYELRLTDQAGSTVRAFVEVVAPPGPDPAVVGVAAGLVGAALVGSLVLAMRAAGRRHR